MSDSERSSPAPVQHTRVAAPSLLALVLLAMTQFMLVLDVVVVNVALPPIQRDLNFTSSTLQLIVTVYALTFGGLLLLGGRLADLRGKRRLFVVGLALFTAASLACGLAWSGPALIGARAVQGVGAALVSPAALALLTTIYAEGAARNRALAVWSAVAAGGGAAGLLIGGALTDFASWRWVFLVNVPIGLLVLLLAARSLPTDIKRDTEPLDLWGAVLVTGGLMALVLGLGQAGSAGFGQRLVQGLLGLGILLLAVFLWLEQRVTFPMLDVRLFRNPRLSGANLALLLMSAVVLGTNYFLTLLLQQHWGYSPFQTGLAFLPLALGTALSAGVATFWVGRLEPRFLLLVGMLFIMVGAGLLSGLSVQGHYLWQVLPGLVLISSGMGLGYTVGTLVATSGVATAQQGAASGLLNTSQQLGGALGLAVLATVAAAAPQFITGLHLTFWVMAGFGLAAALSVWVLVREERTALAVTRK